MSNKGSDICPACRRSMYPGDVVCLRCQERVRNVKPQLLISRANPDLHAPEAAAIALDVRSQITLCAIQLLPAKGRPAKGTPAP